MKFSILDEDGIIAIVNTKDYTTFVDEDWDLKQLFEHLVIQMNRQNLIIWKSNNDGGGQWNIEVLFEPSNKPAFREFTKTINVTNGKLHFVTYTDITMAAQFEDEVLPSKQNADLQILLENGSYNVVIRQLFDPENYEFEDTQETSFELIFTETIPENKTYAENVFWWEED